MVTSCIGYGPGKLVCRVVFFEASYYHAARKQLAKMCGYGDKFRGLSWGSWEVIFFPVGNWRLQVSPEEEIPLLAPNFSLCC